MNNLALIISSFLCWLGTASVESEKSSVGKVIKGYENDTRLKTPVSTVLVIAKGERKDQLRNDFHSSGIHLLSPYLFARLQRLRVAVLLITKSFSLSLQLQNSGQ
jgi:hypothetical protein